MQHGYYALSLAEHPAVRGWLDAAQGADARRARAPARVASRRRRCSATAAIGPGLSVLPELKLRGALLIEVAGHLAPGDAVRRRRASSTRRRA